MVWRAPHVLVVVRCRLCRADLGVRWPERWRFCDRCGERADLRIRGDPPRTMDLPGRTRLSWDSPVGRGRMRLN
jgi:hypothetical protein